MQVFRLLAGCVCVFVVLHPIEAKPLHNDDDCCTQVLDSGISARITWRGVKCALGSSPCNFDRRVLQQKHHETDWAEFEPRIPVMMFNYGDDCELILRDIPHNTRHLKVQLLSRNGQVIADTGPMRPAYQTVYHPQYGTC